MQSVTQIPMKSNPPKAHQLMTLSLHWYRRYERTHEPADLHRALRLAEKAHTEEQPQ